MVSCRMPSNVLLRNVLCVMGGRRIERGRAVLVYTAHKASASHSCKQTQVATSKGDTQDSHKKTGICARGGHTCCSCWQLLRHSSTQDTTLRPPTAVGESHTHTPLSVLTDPQPTHTHTSTYLSVYVTWVLFTVTSWNCSFAPTGSR